MKKLLILLLAVVMLLNLVSCSKPTPEELTELAEKEREERKKLELTEKEREERKLLELPPLNDEDRPMYKYYLRIVGDPLLGIVRSDTPLVHVEFLGKTIDLNSLERRAEYKFRVIDWIRGNTGETEVSLYSPATSYSTPSEMYKFEYSSSLMHEYGVGEEYIVQLRYSKTTNGYYMWPDHYCALDSTGVRWGNEYYITLGSWYALEGTPKTKEEFINFYKLIVVKYKDYEGDRLPVPSDSADSASGG